MEVEQIAKCFCCRNSIVGICTSNSIHPMAYIACAKFLFNQTHCDFKMSFPKYMHIRNYPNQKWVTLCVSCYDTIQSCKSLQFIRRRELYGHKMVSKSLHPIDIHILNQNLKDIVNIVHSLSQPQSTEA